MLSSASVPVLGSMNGLADREEKDGVGDGIVTTSTQWQLLNNAASSADGSGPSKIAGPSSSSSSDAARSPPQSTPSSSSQSQQNSHHQQDVKPTADSNSIPGDINNNNRNSPNSQWEEKESKSHSAAAAEAAAWEERKDEGKDDKDKSKPWIDDSYRQSPSMDAMTTTTTTATTTGVNGVSPVGIADAKLSCDNLSNHIAITSPPPNATSTHKKPSTPPPPFLLTYPQVNPHGLPVPGELTNGERSRAGVGSRDVDHEAQAKSPFQSIDHNDPSHNKSGSRASFDTSYHYHYTPF